MAGRTLGRMPVLDMLTVEHRPFFGPSLGVCPSNQDQRVGTFLLRAVPTWLAQIPRSPEKAVWLYTDYALDL